MISRSPNKNVPSLFLNQFADQGPDCQPDGERDIPTAANPGSEQLPGAGPLGQEPHLRLQDEEDQQERDDQTHLGAVGPPPQLRLGAPDSGDHREPTEELVRHDPLLEALAVRRFLPY